MRNSNVVFALVMVAVLLVMVFAAQGGYMRGKGAGADEFASHIYPSCGVVRSVNHAMDCVVVEDGAGLCWAFYGIEDYDVGDVVAMTMEDMGTETVYDDRVIDARYGGVLGQK